MDEYIGIIKLFAGNFAPSGWAFCGGQQMSIQANTALYSLLGTVYGGNGTTVFNLPDLRGRVAIGTTNPSGSQLSNYTLGQTGGFETVTLITGQLPAHTHAATFTPSGAGSVKASSGDGVAPAPSTANPTLAAAKESDGNVTVNMYNNATPDITLNTGGGGGGGTVTIGTTGNGMPVPILQPFLALNYIICTNGLYPPRD